MKLAGDQGRLGCLLKLWLVDQPGRGAPGTRFVYCFSALTSCKPNSPKSSVRYDNGRMFSGSNLAQLAL